LTWLDALGRGAIVVAYFVVATVWLPDFVLGLGFVQEATTLVRDAVTLAIWGIALGVGMYGLRMAQRRGLFG
jgi:hypothetical protein